MVTAAARTMPPALLDQLAPGGRMVIPIGGDPLAQDLFLIEKDQAAACAGDACSRSPSCR